MNRKYIIILLITFISGLAILSGCTKSNTAKNSEPHQHSEEEVYTCPMHPEIRQNKPGSCPICHMKLVKVEQSKTDGRKADIDLNISPYQADLVGIKPIEVSKKEVMYSIAVSGRMLSRNSVALQVFERDLRFIKRGAKFTGHIEAFPEEEVKGEIVSVDNLADPTSRTVRVVGTLQGNLTNSLIESSFNGNIEIKLGSQIVIPEKSVLFTGNGSIVYIYQDQTLHPKKVILGPKVSEEYVVLKGLEEGNKISSGPNFLIDSESKIRGLNDQKHH